MISLSIHRNLDVSAASGLVVDDAGFHVIADDETHLSSYAWGSQTVTQLSLLPGRLPDEHAERKRLKPDLEALTVLPDGRLLALGSGSTPRRMQGVLIDRSRGDVRPVALADLYRSLSTQLPELNIEGAAVVGDQLWLAQRGNGSGGANALVALSLNRALETLTSGARLDASSVVNVIAVALPALEGIPLTLTDLAPHPSGGLLFTAAAEASPSTYDDGVCVGSAIGHIDERCHVVRCERVSSVCKLEGIAPGAVRSDTFDAWLVADPDDRAQSARLYRAELAR